MARENPLAGIDDMITRYMLSQDMTTRRTLRSAIRQKVAQANLIINELIETRQDKETDGMVAISQRRLSRLVADETKLAALEDAGVDNWDGYAVAMESLREKE